MNGRPQDIRRRRPCSVLIADDHDQCRSAQRLVLEAYGFAVIEARTGSDALVLAEASRPSVMLIDIVLPGIDGLQLTRRLREDATMRHCAIIVVTAYPDPDYRVAALQAGCDEFVTKPVATPHLVELVRFYARRLPHPDYECARAGPGVAIPPEEKLSAPASYAGAGFGRTLIEMTRELDDAAR